MIINFTVGIYPSLLQDMVVKIYEVDINGASSEVHSITIPERNGAGVPTPGAGHQVPYVDSVNVDKVVHLVRLYTASATLLDYWTVQPSANIVNLFTPIRFRIGDGGANTPVAGTSAYVNTDMAGLAATDYIAIRTGYGPVIEGIHIANNVLGGFQLLQPGDVFSGDPAEEWVIMRHPQAVTTPVNDSVVGKQWGPTALLADMFLDVSSAVSYSPGHLRKLIRLAGSAAAYSFTSANIPPVGYIFRVTNFGAYTPGSAAPKVKFDNAPLLWGNTTKTELEIPPTGTVEFVWDGTSWNCSMYMQIPSTTPLSNQIIYNGFIVIGDIPGENGYTITHGQNILVPYKVFGTLISKSANPSRDNTVTWSLIKTSKLPNSFQITAQEIFAETQNLEFDYIIVKA